MNRTFVNRGGRSDHSVFFFWILLGTIMAGVMSSGIAETRWPYLAVAFIPFAAAFVLKKPFLFCFGLYVLLMPFDYILIFESGASLTKYLGIGTMAALLGTGLVEKRIGKPDRTVVWWGVFCAFSVVSMFWAIRPEATYERIPTIAGMYLLYVIVSSYKTSEGEYDSMKKYIVYGGAAASVMSLVLFFLMGVSFLDSHRATIKYGETGQDPNGFAYALLIPFAVSMSLLRSGKTVFRRFLDWGLMGLIFVAIVISFSRGAIIGVVVIAMTFVLSERKKSHILAAVAILGAVTAIFFSQALVERFSQAYETGGAGRFDIWDIGIHALRKYWLTGAGFFNFPKAYFEFGPTFSYDESGPHNLYLGTAVELGVIGFSLMGFAMYKHYSLIRNYPFGKNGTFLKAALFGLLVASFFLDVIHRKSFWLLWTLVMIHHNVKKERFT